MDYTYIRQIYNYLVDHDVAEHLASIDEVLQVVSQVLHWGLYLGLFAFLYWVASKFLQSILYK